MKTHFSTRNVIVAAAVAACLPAAALGSSPSSAASSPLDFLTPLLTEALAFDATLAVSRAAEREQEAAQAQVSADRLPRVSLQAQTGPTKTWSWNQDGPVDPSSPSSWIAQASLNASQNLWSGGTTALREDAAELRTASAAIDTTKRRQSLRAQMAKNLLELSSLSQSLVQRNILLQQAKELEQIATRKNASGFLGKKELQETQREALRAQLDVQDAALEFDVRMARFNRTYGLKENALTKERLERYSPLLEAAARAGEKQLTSPQFLQDAAARSLDLQQAAVFLKASELDAQVANRQKFSPSLDLSAGLTATRVDNSDVPAALRDQAADARLSASASLSYSMALFAPEASTAAEAAAARLEVTRVRRTQTERALQDKAGALQDENKLLLQRLGDSQKLLAMSKDLRDKNVRLFEAGAFDVVTVVASQQDVARQQQTELDVRARLNALGLDALALSENGLLP